MKHYDMKPIFELMDDNIKILENLLPKKQTVEYLSKIQNDQKYIGERAKAVRIANGIELTSIYDRDSAERIERGQFDNILVKHLVQYAHEIGGKLSLFNTTPE